jgi:hypothetical protein
MRAVMTREEIAMETMAAGEYRGSGMGEAWEALGRRIKEALLRGRVMPHEILDLFAIESQIFWEFVCWYCRLETRARREREAGNLLASGGNGSGEGCRDQTPTQGSHYNTDMLLRRIIGDPDALCDAVDLVGLVSEQQGDLEAVIARLRAMRLGAPRTN